MFIQPSSNQEEILFITTYSSSRAFENTQFFVLQSIVKFGHEIMLNVIRSERKQKPRRRFEVFLYHFVRETLGIGHNGVIDRPTLTVKEVFLYLFTKQ